MHQTKNVPDLQKLSIIIATILLSYALAQFVNAPGRVIPLQVIGIFIPIEIDLNTVVLVAVAGMTATGADWLIRDHPELKDQPTIPHWLLPALTAWIINIALNALAITPIWWLTLLLGGIFILVVMLAEYIVIDKNDVRHPLATTGLNALAYVQFLILSISLRAMGVRLLMSLPALGLAAGVMSLRIFKLKVQEKWLFQQSILNLIVIAQFGTVLHYLPFSPISFGIGLLAILYALVNFTQNLQTGLSPRRAMLEPLIVAAMLWGSILIIK